MAYFRELPNIEYISLLKNRNRNDETLTVKNIFRRAKLRTDIDQAITAFEYYQITEDMRPDTVAEEIYDNPELDWIILIANNITNLRDQWPLSHHNLDNYMLEKYGSYEALAEIHHYETKEIKDENNRIILQKGLVVDENFQFTYSQSDNSIVTANPTGPVSNYEYEVKLNEDKRTIKVLKVDYVSAIVTDLKNSMKYNRSSQFVNRELKFGYNPRISGV